MDKTISSLYPVTRSQSSDLSDVVKQEICNIDFQLTLLQQLRCYHIKLSTKVSEECFQHLESVPQRIKAVLKEKMGPT